ncbi:MAG: type II toxin-antitoxin system VapC family toxin [Candidatus Bathyarchaeia archaeon]
MLDSNILVKLVTNEPNSKEARATITTLLKKGYTLHTVDIALAESLSALWKHAKIHKDLKPEETKQAIQDLTRIYDKIDILTTREIAEETTDIALTQNITVYDALYIAATQKLNATLYTADQKLHNIANKITNTKLLKT